MLTMNMLRWMVDDVLSPCIVVEGREDFIPSTQLNNAQVILDNIETSTNPKVSLMLGFLPLPKLPMSSSRMGKGSKPIIDYIKSILMTSDEYIKQLEEKPTKRADIDEARRKKKEQIDLNI